MPKKPVDNSRLKRLQAAFAADGYDIETYFEDNGKYCIRAAHREAFNFYR